MNTSSRDVGQELDQSHNTGTTCAVDSDDTSSEFFDDPRQLAPECLEFVEDVLSRHETRHQLHRFKAVDLVLGKANQKDAQVRGLKIDQDVLQGINSRLVHI